MTSPATALGPERKNLARQVQTFRQHAKKLKKIFKDTVKVLSDLQDFDDSLSINSILALQAQKCISNVVSGRTALVVFGETRLRSYIVNEVLGEAILPLPWEPNEKWRMVHFKYKKHRVMSHMRDGYDLATDRPAAQALNFNRIPRECLLLEGAGVDRALGDATLEIGLNNAILEAGFEIICSPTSVTGVDAIRRTLQVCQVELHPFFIYGHDMKTTLSDQQMSELEMIRRLMPDVPLLFATVSPDNMQPSRRKSSAPSPDMHGNSAILSYIYNQLCKVNCFQDANSSLSIPAPPSINPHDNPELNPEPAFNFIPVDTMVTNFMEFVPELLSFVQCNMRQQITNAASSLHEAHARCLQTLILYAHDLTRDSLVTPRKIKYARDMEERLYAQLIELASRKQSEIKDIVTQTITEAEDEIVMEVVELELEGVSLEESGAASDAKSLRQCITMMQDHIFLQLSKQISTRLVSSVNYLRESVIGTLQRVIDGLEETVGPEQVTLSDKTSSKALRQILDSAYALEFSERTSTSAVRLFLERVKQTFSGPSYKTTNVRDKQWREKYTRQLIDSLSASRLAKSICAQFRSKVGSSHEAFMSAMKQLENRQSGRLKEREGQRETIRKILTPKMARLSLSSVALRDGIVHGLPVTGRELGRGQYGVVFQCAEWAGKGPLAVKSVVPPDEKHWNDLALEFHYTWTLPRNDRVVSIVGALIDDDYSNGSNAVVLFIMPRYPRDLHAALKVGLDFGSRLQIALDVIEGIRFLHSQGLLHRDIKLKNVLLDPSNRGTLTDLGFCKPEAMMTCTIVGTPIHMAPELFGGSYDSSVDIYAFGILFWYICSNDTKLPGAFDACSNKEQLWTAVRKGLRPERLPRFDSDCWELMTSCWHGDSIQRPLVGDIAMRLILIMKRIGRKPLKN